MIIDTIYAIRAVAVSATRNAADDDTRIAAAQAIFSAIDIVVSATRNAAIDSTSDTVRAAISAMPEVEVIS